MGRQESQVLCEWGALLYLATTDITKTLNRGSAVWLGVPGLVGRCFSSCLWLQPEPGLVSLPNYSWAFRELSAVLPASLHGPVPSRACVSHRSADSQALSWLQRISPPFLLISPASPRHSLTSLLTQLLSEFSPNSSHKRAMTPVGKSLCVLCQLGSSCPGTQLRAQRFPATPLPSGNRFLHRYWGLDSGPQGCAASSLLTEPSLSPYRQDFSC